MSRRASRKLPERLQGLFASVPDPDPAGEGDGRHPPAGVPGGWLWECDLQGRYTWCSPEVERFLGRPVSELIGREVASTWLSEESAAMVRPLMSSGRPVDGLRLEARAADGSELQLLFTAGLRPGLNGKPAGYRGAVQVLAIQPPSVPASPATVEAEPAEAPAATPAEAPAAVAEEPVEDVHLAAAEASEANTDPERESETWSAPDLALEFAEAPGELAPAAELETMGPEHPVSPEPLTAELPAEVQAGPVEPEPAPVMAQPPEQQESPEPPPVASPGGEPAAPAVTIPTPSDSSVSQQTVQAPASGTGTQPLRRKATAPLRQTGRLRQTGKLRQTGPLASQLAVAASVAPEEVKPIEPPPLLAAWGPTSAYLDSAEGLQPVAPEPGLRVQRPRIEGNRLLVPIQVKDEVLGVLSFDENDRGDPWLDDDIAMAVAISEQLAVALQDARSVQLTEQALEEMREADRLKTQFLANMSHELRTPLNSIIGFSRVILKGIDGPVNETQEQDLKAIHQAGLHLLGLINDILDLSKIEAGKMELTFGDVDLAEIVRGVMSTAAGLVKDKTIELVARVPENLPLIQADSIRIRQILLNLVSNAAKFTDDGQIELSVTLLEDIEPPEMLVSVADTGPGIAPEDQSKLFEPFSQVDASPTRKTGGTGLGLSICRHLVELHGGTIWVESQPGQGSVFFFTMPTRPPEAGAVPAPADDRPLVLAFDERPAALEAYRQTLGDLGFDVQALSSTDRISGLLARRSLALVLVDPLLPQQRAWATVSSLRQVEAARRTPVLMGGVDPERGVAYRLHASDFRLRPTERHELLGAVRRLTPHPGKPIRLLVIEEDQAEAEAIQAAAQADPLVHLTLTSNSTEAYAATRKEVPDVIVLSLMMDRAEGFRTLEILRKDARLRGSPVLALIAAEPHPELQRQLTLYAEYLHRQGTTTPEAYLNDLRALAQAIAAH